MAARAATSTTQLALGHLLNTIRNLFFHDDDDDDHHHHDYHPQTLGLVPIISFICPESESSIIWLRTHLFLPLGQKEIRKTGLPLSFNSFKFMFSATEPNKTFLRIKCCICYINYILGRIYLLYNAPIEN